MQELGGETSWLKAYVDGECDTIEGLISVADFEPSSEHALEVIYVMEKAKAYSANAVFFELNHDGKSVAQAFIYKHDSAGSTTDGEFAERHQKLWSWGGVPLVYRVVPGAVQLFRCRHEPPRINDNGDPALSPFRTLELAALIADDAWWRGQDAWWDWRLLRNGALWDEPKVCRDLLSSGKAAHQTLIDEVKKLYLQLGDKKLLPKSLRRRLLILSILIAYLDERRAFKKEYWAKFVDGATEFHQVLADGNALVELMGELDKRFNGHVFYLRDKDKQELREHPRLSDFSDFVWGHRQTDGQLTLWKRYSFADLPIELISNIYQLFVKDASTAVYTPPFLVRLMVDEAMDERLMARLMEENNEQVVLDPACGSGIFLVEAYRRLVLFWRKKNGWAKPKTADLKRILSRHIRGVDFEDNAAEVTAFSLCLALCDSLSDQGVRQSVKPFPELLGKTIHGGCFFQAKAEGKISEPVGLILGNPPFSSSLTTQGARRETEVFNAEYGPLPDKQLGYLFLHASMSALAPGGRLCLLQHYGFLYNVNPRSFRRQFIGKHCVREILDFVSINGLFGSRANTKVLCVIADAEEPAPDGKLAHMVFRRSSRVESQQGFDIDYYDIHWFPWQMPIENDHVWRCNLLGGSRVLDLASRLGAYGTLEDFTRNNGWGVPREGWMWGNKNDPHDATHIIGQPYVEPTAFDSKELSQESFLLAPERPYQWPRSEEQYRPPLLLIHEHADLPFATWHQSYLTYPQTVAGISAANGNKKQLSVLAAWFRKNKQALQAAVVMLGDRPLIAKATALKLGDICKLPCPETGDLEISQHEQILVDDIVAYYRDFVRVGSKSAMMTESGKGALDSFNDVFLQRINGIYSANPLQPLEPVVWPEAICQPYMFGDGAVDWSGAEQLRGKLASLLVEQRNCGLNVTRIAFLYDDSCIYLLKPNRLRYWLKSIALRDSDEVLEELRRQGF